MDFEAENLTSAEATVEKFANPPMMAFSCGFSNAKGQKIVTSLAAIEKAKKSFMDDAESIDFDAEKAISTELTVEKTVNSLPVAFNCGFSSAKGQKIVTSLAAIEKAKKSLLDDAESVNFEAEKQTSVEPTVEKCVNLPPMAFNCGFSSAKGQKIVTSAAAIEKAKKSLLDDTESMDIESKKSTFAVATVETTVNPPPVAFSCGFSSAKGQKIATSSAALDRARNLFQKLDDDEFGPGKSNEPEISAELLHEPVVEKTVAQVSIDNAKFSYCDNSRPKITTPVIDHQNNINRSKSLSTLGFESKK